jgi:uncharacterized protein involved in type VI secretion and phage assembly
VNLIDLLTIEAEPETRRGKIYGVVVGVVTNNQDPDKLGRVKVRFPWLDEDDESHWARVATTMAGKDRGTWFLPEVDDEVLVIFEHGDVRFPYVVGALWNGVDTPPRDNADGKNDPRVIRSRSGHELVFNDADGKEQVEIHTKAGHQILLDDSSGKEKITIKDKSGDNQIEIDSAQNAIAIASKTKLSIKSQTIEIEADSSLTLKGQTIEIKSAGQMTAEASSTMTIKGSMVKIN